MTTNREWLYSLDVADLADWFDAEHVENQERALDGDTESESSNTDAVSERYATAFKWLDRLGYGKGGVVGGSLNDTPEQGEVVMPLESWREYLGTKSENEDSREKLEADVRKIAEAYNMDTQRHGTERFEHELYYSIIHLLNRQAAIDDSICDDCSSDFYKLQEAYDALEDEVDKLTAERDELQEQLNRTTSAMNRAAGKWAKTDAELRNALDIMRIWISDDAHLGESAISYEFEKAEGLRKLESIKQAITVTIGGLEAERERYREKFGKCLDYADAIHALMDDEGLA